MTAKKHVQILKKLQTNKSLQEISQICETFLQNFLPKRK